jgi:hypothetical protein
MRNEELYNFPSSPDIIKFIKPRKIGWVGHLEGRERTNTYYISDRRHTLRDLLLYLGRNRKIVLDYFLEEYVVTMSTKFIWFGTTGQHGFKFLIPQKLSF